MSDAVRLVFEGDLSEPLRALIAGERDNIDEVVRRAVQMIVASVPDYSLSSDPRIVDDLRKASWINAELWFGALLDGTAVTEASLDPIVAFARRRVHQGISMTGLLRAYRIIARAFWIRMVEAAGDNIGLKAELTSRVSPFLLQHFDIVAEGIATSYLQEQSQHARWRDRLRQELWSIVGSRPDDGHGFRNLADALGLSADQPHCAIALRLSTEARGQPERYIDHPILILGRKLGVQPDQLMRALHRDHLVIWVPQSAGHPTLHFERRLAEVAGDIANNSNSVTAVGLGLPGIGAHGWLASMEQAFRALQDTKAMSVPPVHRYSRVMIDDAIRSNRNVSDFVSSLLDPLASEPTLLDTLTSYLRHGLHRKETAAVLSVHPNTLDHRLSRIETLLDGSFSDIEWIERLNAALRIYRNKTGP